MSFLSRARCLALILIVSAVSLAAAEPDTRKRVAIVIDDGPDPAQNAAMLAALAVAGARVTFAHVGRNVAANPAMARAVIEEGHEIINHSYTHPHFKELDDDAIRREIGDTQAAVREATGRTPQWFWAPFGDWDDRIEKAVRSAGLEHYPALKFHFISTNDWDTAATDRAAIMQRATTGIVDKTVILMHEWPANTLAQLPEVLAELKRQGAEFITFSELAAAE